MTELTTQCFFAKLLYSLTKNSTFVIGTEIAFLIGLVSIWYLYRSKNRKKLTEKEKESMIERWVPESLIDDTPENHPALLNKRIVSETSGKQITINGHNCLNLATHNYLGLLNSSDIKESAIAAVRKYGVGSCGPRGFYGTIDVHLELEERLAKFMHMEESVVYSYGFSTIASAIAAYCKRGDLLFVDECVNFSIQKGIDASRSKVFYFKHNDVTDLERLLKEQDAIDRKNPKKASKIRRFIIVEAIYVNTGEICPLSDVVDLRKRYKLRLILDESVSFGTLGSHGRGLTEHLNINRDEVDLICSTLENAIGSIGGFSVGTTFIVDHQRLSGLGYCFSASAPPLLAQAAIAALDHFENEPEMFTELNEKCKQLNEKLKCLTQFTFRGHELSPIKHLYLKNVNKQRSEKVDILEKIVDKCIEQKLAIVNATYLENAEKYCPEPSLRVIANRLLTNDDIQFAFDTIERVSSEVLSSL
ncbi:serine palmitoyltransferase 1 [Contarinia nasturtii]|uniref:serine palmitoyltransferase 1 n=1 Tax=Contarinia nasturtii TaxID=265458 RepID=UPI0012D4695E|nr:serine palmitoyltransferase 1 [Contarinia nasturtii]